MKVKNWKKFQHFKDRRPPWVKLYRDLLDDPDWHSLDPESAKVLVMLWLIASEDEQQQGNLPDVRKLAFRLRLPEKTVQKSCSKLSHWLYQDDIKTISASDQDDAPETETETETETDSSAPDALRPRLEKIDFDFSKGAFKGITEEQELAWQEAFPAVPIPPAIAQAAAWLCANPANRKSNYQRFLVNWFSRAQDKAARIPSQQSTVRRLAI